MKLNCPACKAEMKTGKTELILKRDRNVVVVEDVPAMVCPQCGEASIDAKISQAAYSLAETEIKRGVALEFCKFQAA
jgi:YgiT-type zinc finger domain-containing protein